MTQSSAEQSLATGQTIEILPARFGPAPGARARIGMIALASGMTGEAEMHRLLPEGALLFTTRVRNSNTIDMANLAAMEAGMTQAASTLLPEGRLDCVIYCCTSGTIAMGESIVAERIRAVKPGVAVTTPFTAAVAACQALGVRRLALLAPYVPAVTEAMIAHLEERGLEIAASATFDVALDSEISRIEPTCCLEAALALDRPEVEAVFLCCTGLRVSGIIEDLEDRLGKPVITSNQALAWHALRLAGDGEPVAGFGRLMKLP